MPGYEILIILKPWCVCDSEVRIETTIGCEKREHWDCWLPWTEKQIKT